MKTLSIYIKMIVYFLAISLLPMVALSFLAYYQVNEVIRNDNRGMLRMVAVDSAYKIESELYQRMVEVNAWSLLPQADQSLRTGHASPANELFDSLIAAYPMYDLLVLVDARRHVVAVNRRSHLGRKLPLEKLIGTTLSDGPWFAKAAEKGIYLSGFLHSPEIQQFYGTKGETQNISVPIKAADGRIQGYLVAYLNWAYMQDMLDVVQASLTDLYAAMVFMIEFDTHKLIGHRDVNLYGEQYIYEIDLAGQVEKARAGTFEYNWPVLKTIGYAHVRLRDQRISLPWLVCVEVPNDVIYVQSKFMRDVYLFMTLGAAFFIVIIVYFIARRFSEPILKLVEGAQQIAAGNINIEMTVDSVDEIGILANAFNQMLDALRERDERLQTTNLKLEEANRLKSEFLANMSHELRTPMNSIIGFTSLVLQRAGDKLPELHQQNLAKVRKNALHLLKLLNSILDLSKIEAGGMDVMVDHFSLRALIENCVSTIAPLAEERRLETSVDVPPEDLKLFQDMQKLQQILLNLLGNAVKFTEKGYIRVGFVQSEDCGLGHLAHETKGGWVRIWVEDSGIGLEDKDLETIFSEFRQVDGSPTRRYGGSGLGLAISKKLVKLLGGDISVKSEPGFGSTFTIVIPVRHESAAPLVREETGHELPGFKGVAREAGSIRTSDGSADGEGEKR